MSNVVQFLEALACDPRALSANDYATLVVAAELSPGVECALLANDPSELNRNLVGRTFACLIFPAEDQPNDGEEKQDEDDEAPEQESNSLAA